MGDDDRIGESNSYLDRRADRLASETAAVQETSALFGAILDHDDPRARWILGIPPEGAESASVEDDVDEADADVEQLFQQHLHMLGAQLKYPTSLPADLTQEWLTRVQAIDISDPAAGLRILEGLGQDFLRIVWRLVEEEAPDA